MSHSMTHTTGLLSCWKKIYIIPTTTHESQKMHMDGSNSPAQNLMNCHTFQTSVPCSDPNGSELTNNENWLQSTNLLHNYVDHPQTCLMCQHSHSLIMMCQE